MYERALYEAGVVKFDYYSAACYCGEPRAEPQRLQVFGVHIEQVVEFAVCCFKVGKDGSVSALDGFKVRADGFDFGAKFFGFFLILFNECFVFAAFCVRRAPGGDYFARDDGPDGNEYD